MSRIVTALVLLSLLAPACRSDESKPASAPRGSAGPASARDEASATKRKADSAAKRDTGHPPAVRLVAVGDILLGDAADASIAKHGYGWPLRRVREVIADHDLLVGNLEGPITHHDQPIDPDKAYVYRMKRSAANALADAGFDLLCLANNHALDYGLPGLRDTLFELQQGGIDSFGAGASYAKATSATVVRRAGLTIGFVGLMVPYGAYRDELAYFAEGDRPGVAPLDEATLQAVARADAEVDTLVIWVHWGNNYKPVSWLQRKWARRLVTAGADLVIGHHPHIVQGLDIVDGVPVLYSLGNFVFGTPGRFRKVGPALRHGWVAEIALVRGGVSEVALTPLSVDNRVIAFQPRPDVSRLADIVAAVQTPFTTQLRIEGRRALWRATPRRARE